MLTLLMGFVMGITYLAAQANEYNNIDENGNRVGKWMFYLDNDLSAVEDSTDYAYQKIVSYVSGRAIGYVNYYYKSGKLYFQTPVKSLDPDVYSDGEIRYFAETGEKIQVLNYHNGMLNGKAEYYYPDGSLYLQGNYAENVRTGRWKQWDTEGGYGIGAFSAEKPEGNWTFYHSDGSVKAEGRFQNGIKIGVWVEYSDRGEIAEGNYTEGHRDGTWVCRYWNEKPCYIGSYRQGQKDGFWQEWDASGRLSKGTYSNGLREGTWVTLNTGGRKILQGNYVKGIEEGLWLRFDNLGNEIEKTLYENGFPIRQ